MRNDARQLLEKLSRQDFRYKQFEDPYSDIKLWPIFEALLQDSRVVGQEPKAPVDEKPSRSRLVRSPSKVTASRDPGFLTHYAQDSQGRPRADGSKGDVDLRAFLSNLAGGAE